MKQMMLPFNSFEKIVAVDQETDDILADLNLLPFSIDRAKHRIERNLGIILHDYGRAYASMTDYETYGLNYPTASFWVIDPNHGFKKSDNKAFVLHISMNEDFQFFYRSVPIINSLYTSEERSLTIISLYDYPKPISQLTKKIYAECYKTVKKIIGTCNKEYSRSACSNQ